MTVKNDDVEALGKFVKVRQAGSRCVWHKMGTEDWFHGVIMVGQASQVQVLRSRCCRPVCALTGLCFGYPCPIQLPGTDRDKVAALAWRYAGLPIITCPCSAPPLQCADSGQGPGQGGCTCLA